MARGRGAHLSYGMQTDSYSRTMDNRQNGPVVEEQFVTMGDPLQDQEVFGVRWAGSSVCLSHSLSPAHLCRPSLFIRKALERLHQTW
jgi:hypothetical protein